MSDGNMKWICLRWKAEMIVGVEFSQVVLQEKHVYFFFWGGALSFNFTFNPQTVLEMMVVFFCNCIE